MKKIIALLLFFTGFAFAKEYYIYVNSPEEVDAMADIINGIVMIFKSNTYLDLLKLAVLFGTFVVFFMWVVGSYRDGGKEGGYQFTKYHVGIVAILIIIFSAQSSVVIKSNYFPHYYDDNASTTQGIVIDNVPEVVAYSISFFNKFGTEMQKMFVQGMQTAGASSYSTARDGYASSLRDDLDLLSLKFASVDRPLGEIMDSFIGQCIYIPFSAHPGGSDLIDEIYKSPNIKQTIDNWYASDVKIGNDLSVKDFYAEYEGEMYTCGDLWNIIKNEKLADFNNKAAGILKNLDSRDLEMITGVGDVPKSDFDEIAIQAGIINSLTDNKDLPVGVSYAAGKSQAEFVQENLASGYYMSKMLPEMQIIFRAVIYGLFPLIVVISLLPGGFNIIKNYAKAAIWIEMWGPVQEILNHFLMKFNQHNIAGDITAYNTQHMLSDTASLAGMAGYLYLMVPAISWGILSGSFTMLQGLGAGIAKNMSGNVKTESVAADAGKIAKKEAISAETGKSFSLAEAMHFEQNINGARAGAALAVDYDEGVENVKQLSGYEKHKQYEELKMKKDLMKALGYSVDTKSIAKNEARVSAGNLSKGLGEISTAGVVGMHGAGRHAGRIDIANSSVEKSFGDKVTAANVTKSSEDIIKTNERRSAIEGAGFGFNEFVQTSARQDFLTQEAPNFLRNDRNFDGKISNDEIAFEAAVNNVDAKRAITDKHALQEQLAQNAMRNKTSGSSAVRGVQAATEKLVSDNDTAAAILGASAVKAGVGAAVENANQRKDARTLEQLNSNNKRLEDAALLDSKRMLGDLAQTKTQTETTGTLIKDLMQQKSELREKIGDKMGDTEGMSYAQRELAKDKTLMQSLASVGIADANLTHNVLSAEVANVENSVQSRLRAGLEKRLTGEELQTLDTYNSLVAKQEHFRATGDTEKAEIYDGVIENFEKFNPTLKQVVTKAESYAQSSEAQALLQEREQKLNAIYSNYESAGLIKRGSDGSISYADTVKTIESLDGEQKALYVERVKRSLDGLKTSTIGIDGMQLERVDNVLGDHVTERASATKEWTQTGRFTHDIQYYAVDNDYVSAENMARFNTSVNTVKGALGIYGFSRVVVR